MVSKDVVATYEATIGIECHVQLRTKTKLFSGADNDARDKLPNTTVSPICFGLPGTLPVLNKEAISLAVRAGIALNAEIAPMSSFDRKHYFYPDLPKGYQITQLERPIVGPGAIDVPQEDGTSFTVRITRAHIEEDAGKLTHPDGADYSLVDLNRAGTPLIEIVSEADMHTAAQARAYAQELYLLMTYADVTEGNLYHGNMRFDVNISVAKKGAAEWGTRAEVKNLNSFRSIEKAAEYEFLRQVELLERGEKVVQETRGWHDAKQKTFSQRSKEDAQDYRYFPDADLPPIEVTDAQMIAAKDSLSGRLPGDIRSALTEMGLTFAVVQTLVQQPRFADLTLRLVASGPEHAKRVALWMVNMAPREGTEELRQLPEDAHFLALSELVSADKLSSTAAKEVLTEMLASGESPEAIATKKNLLQVSDDSAIATIVDDVLADPASQKAVADIKAGEMKAVGFIVGQTMKRSQGKANPKMVQDILRQKLGL